jgi:hypothetical protein
VIKAPIVIEARGDLLVFAELATALRELTPEEVRAGAYPVAYDVEGRLLRIEVYTRERRFLGLFREVTEHVRIVAYEHIPTHERALEALLARFIAPTAVPALIGRSRAGRETGNPTG